MQSVGVFTVAGPSRAVYTGEYERRTANEESVEPGQSVLETRSGTLFPGNDDVIAVSRAWSQEGSLFWSRILVKETHPDSRKLATHKSV
jgi:hypothetical protein